MLFAQRGTELITCQIGQHKQQHTTIAINLHSITGMQYTLHTYIHTNIVELNTITTQTVPEYFELLNLCSSTITN